MDGRGGEQKVRNAVDQSMEFNILPETFWEENRKDGKETGQRIIQEKNVKMEQQEFPDLKGRKSAQNNG